MQQLQQIVHLKSVSIHFAPGSNKRSLFIESPIKMHGCGTRHAPNHGIDAKGGVWYLLDSRAIVILP